MRARERISHEDGQEFRLTSQQLRLVKRAQIVTGAAIHPDTGELIPWPQRLSSFLFMQLPLSAGLTLAPPTTFNTLIW